MRPRGRRIPYRVIAMSDVSRPVRLRRWWLYRRARLSIPSLLADYDERKVISLVAAVNAGTAILTLTVVAWLIDVPLLFPALAPSAFIMFSTPFAPAAAPRSVIIGHFAGLTVGYTTWHLVSLASGRPVGLETTGWPVLLSASIAMAAICLLLVYLSCPHAPSCASALILALGAAKGWVPLLGMAAGVVLLTAQAVLISRLAGVNMPIWSPRPHDAHRNGPD